MMKLNFSEINPYIRYARRLKHKPIGTFMCAVDYHFYYLHSEQCNLEIDGTKYALKSGTMVIIPPGIKYSFNKNTDIDIVSVNFDYTQNHTEITEGQFPIFAAKFKKNDIIETVCFKDCELLNKPIVLENMGHLDGYIEKILKEYIYKKKFYIENVSGIFKQCLAEMLRANINDNKNTKEINKILSYIHNNFCKKIDNKTIAELIGYHSYYVNRLMKKTTGTTLRQYVIDCRINSAKKHLTETDYSILEVSEMCGYKNFSNFSNDFKHKCGVSPSVYRKSCKQIL